jgi:hypothetical protein
MKRLKFGEEEEEEGEGGEEGEEDERTGCGSEIEQVESALYGRHERTRMRRRTIG